MTFRRWGVAIRGLESGRVSPLPFCRWWRRSTAEAWVRKMNITSDPQPLTRYEVHRW